jgi:hypothetical protein
LLVRTAVICDTGGSRGLAKRKIIHLVNVVLLC